MKELDQKCAELASKMANKFHVEFQDRTYHVDALLAALEAAGLEYAQAHRDDILQDGKKKSKKLPNGVVSWSYKSGGYKYREGESSKSVVERLADRFGFVELFLKWLRSLRLRGSGKTAVTLDRVIALEAKVDLKRVKVHHEKGELSDCDLEEIGIEIRKPIEECSLKPNEYTPD